MHVNQLITRRFRISFVEWEFLNYKFFSFEPLNLHSNIINQFPIESWRRAIFHTSWKTVKRLKDQGVFCVKTNNEIFCAACRAWRVFENYLVCLKLSNIVFLDERIIYGAQFRRSNPRNFEETSSVSVFVSSLNDCKRIISHVSDILNYSKDATFLELVRDGSARRVCNRA